MAAGKITFFLARQTDEQTDKVSYRIAWYDTKKIVSIFFISFVFTNWEEVSTKNCLWKYYKYKEMKLFSVGCQFPFQYFVELKIKYFIDQNFVIV